MSVSFDGDGDSGAFKMKFLRLYAKFISKLFFLGLGEILTALLFCPSWFSSFCKSQTNNTLLTQDTNLLVGDRKEDGRWC